MLALAKERRTPFCEPMAALTDRRNPLLRVTQALPLLSLKSKDPTCYSSGHLRPLAWRKSLRARQSFRARQSLLRTRFCIGSGNCPVLVQVMKNCGSDADQIAQEICTTYLATMASTSLMIVSITLGSLGPTMIANFDEIIERVHQAPTVFIGQN